MKAVIQITFEGRVITRELTTLPDYTKAEMLIDHEASKMTKEIVYRVQDERKAAKRVQ